MTGETVEATVAAPSVVHEGRIGNNLVYLLVSQVATWIVTVATIIIAPEYLGPDGFGVIGFAAAFVSFVTLAASLGTGAYLTRTIARDSAAIGEYIYNGVLMKIVFGAGLSVVAVVVAKLIGTTGDALVLVVVGCVGMLFTVVNEVFIGAMAGLEWMGRPALWNTVQSYIASCLGIAVLLAGGGVVAFGSVIALSAVIPMVANGRVAWRLTAGSHHVNTAAIRRIVVGGAPLMVLSALTLVYGSINVPILTSMAGDATTGWFTLATRFVSIPMFIVTAAMTAFFPRFSAHGEQQTPEFAGYVNRAIRLVVVFSVPAAAGLVVISRDLIELLYDSRFTEAVPVMQILALQIPIVAVDVILAMALIASNRQNQYLVVAGLAAVLSPIAGVVAINWSMNEFDNGGIGVALVTVGIETLILGGALLLRATGVMDGATVSMCLRCVLAAGITAATVWALDPLPLVVRIIVGVAVYAVASFVLRTVTKDDVRQGLAIVSSAAARARRPPGSTTAV